jgi:hypothetical protein
MRSTAPTDHPPTPDILLLLLVATLLGGCLRQLPVQEARPFQTVDAAGRPIERLETGASLHIGATALEPRRLYEFRVAVDVRGAPDLSQAVSFARLTADPSGTIPPFLLWYHSGVVGCSVPPEEIDARRFRFGSFDDAEAALRNARLTVSIHPVPAAPERSTRPLETRAGPPVAMFELPVAARSSPMVYPSDDAGCLHNSQLVDSTHMHVSGRNFDPGEELLISVVPNQRAWYTGDRVMDVTGELGAPAPVRVVADARGRFTVRVWDSGRQRRGAYDIVAQRGIAQRADLDTIAISDIISHAGDTGYILYLRYPVGGPTMDIAGRPIAGSPYFEFADSFADDGDVVWGAVDPTYVPLDHPGGRYAAYYVVEHRDVDGWDPMAGGSQTLVDVSGGIEIMPVKAGCINVTDTPIWYPPLTIGDYDAVVDFGSTTADTPGDYVTDANYDPPLDFLDGADQIGFTVAKDPYELGPLPIGHSEYSQDDFFPTLGTASNVDLRGVVRYPATAAGTDVPVAPGVHPIFVIQHGNHRICESPLGACHDACVVRTENHKGYMRLLDILASHGVIAVSIDAYDLSGSFSCGVQGWIQERGQLILRHLELWSHMHDPSTFPTYPDFFAGRFNGHVDMSRISVSGHSRGGEASVSAYLQNTVFDIGSVSSIAPVDFHAHVLPDVPYFVILPAADGDVSGLSGTRIYDRAGSATTPVDAMTKSGIYVYGANHNFFNTVWASHGDDSPATRDDYILAVDQQRLGEAYLAGFTRAHLLGESVYEDMLRGRLVFPSTGGFKIYPLRHEKSHTRHESGTGSPASSGVTVTSVSGPSVHVTQALQVTWTSTGGELSYPLPPAQRDASSFEVLSFRVTQTNSALNPPTGPQDFTVELRGGGVTRAFFSRRFGTIPKPYNHPYPSLNHTVMTTVRIPLHSFILNRSGLTLEDVDTIRFRFSNPSTGEIYVDDIEFSR